MIDDDLAERLALAVGHRNVLVHRYAPVDDSIVLAAAHRLDEFDRFVTAIGAWLSSQRG